MIIWHLNQHVSPFLTVEFAREKERLQQPITLFNVHTVFRNSLKTIKKHNPARCVCVVRGEELQKPIH